jgi:hypothetical protein
MVLDPYYWSGDQTYYRAFYTTREGVGLGDSFADYNGILGSSEPGYFLLVMACYSWLDKDVLMSLLNGLFGFLLGRGLVALNTSRIVMLLVAVNYYLLMLYLAADRLKLALLFVLLSAVRAGAWQYVMLTFSMLSHVQTAVLIIGRVLANLIPTLRILLAGRLRLQLLLAPVVVVFLGLPLWYLREYVATKAEVYMGGVQQGVSPLLKPLAFAAITLVYTSGRRLEALALHAPLIIGSAMVGSERLAVFSYFIFMYYGVQVRGGLNLGVLSSCAYFAFTGVVFMFDVVTYGTGYYWKISILERLFG